MVSITDKEFEQLSKLIYEHFGIYLPEKKMGLVNSRLQEILRNNEFTSFQQYYDYLKDGGNTSLSQLVDKITTNFTYFYREEKHFEFFSEEVLPYWEGILSKNNNKDLRIWVAGCASGEEAYTLMILMKEYFKDQYRKWSAGLLATDISDRALTFAKNAIYPKDRLERLPKHLLNKYFTKVAHEQFAVSDEIKNEVVFRRFNLMNEKYPFKAKFHSIFCRNVMIYFDAQSRDKTIKNFINFMHDDSHLFIGHSESIPRIYPSLQYVMPAVYRKINE